MHERLSEFFVPVGAPMHPEIMFATVNWTTHVDAGVIYFLMGTRHGLLLTVSLYALRRYYHGPIALLTDKPDGMAGRICADCRLNVFPVPITPLKLRRNSALLTKTTLHRWTPFNPTIFLDADTIPLADPSPLFALTKPGSMVLTQFSNWRLLGSPYTARCARFARAAACWDLFQHRLRTNDPAVNTGVYAFCRQAGLLEQVHQLAMRGQRVFIPDECAMQLTYPDWPHVLVSDTWNSSPRHGLDKPNARIIHAHGGKVLHRNVKTIFLDVLKQVWQANIGYIQEWASQDDWLKDHRKEVETCTWKL